MDRREEAYRLWAGMEDRNFSAVARELRMTRQAVAKWAKADSWEDRLQEEGVGAVVPAPGRLPEAPATATVPADASKATWAAQSSDLASVVLRSIEAETVIDPVTGERRLSLPVEDIDDIVKLVRAFKELIQLALLLKDEPTTRVRIESLVATLEKMDVHEQIEFLRGTENGDGPGDFEEVAEEGPADED